MKTKRCDQGDYRFSSEPGTFSVRCGCGLSSVSVSSSANAAKELARRHLISISANQRRANWEEALEIAAGI